MNNLLFALESILPIFLLILFGFLLRRFTVVNGEFVSIATRIIFRFALPVMVFQRMVNLQEIPISLFLSIAIFIGATSIVFIVMWIATGKLSRPVQGSMVQGSFRSNIAIIGLAVVGNSLGEEALAHGVVLLAIVMPLYNLYSIIILSRCQVQENMTPVRQVLRSVLTNPLIWAVIIGLPLGLLKIGIPPVVDRTFDILAQLTLPLALISVGASLRLDSLVHGMHYWITAVLVKLIILPAMIYFSGSMMGIEPDMTAVLVITAACPTAVASFVMAESFGADSRLAGEIVSVSTAFSIFTLALWLSIVA